MQKQLYGLVKKQGKYRHEAIDTFLPVSTPRSHNNIVSLVREKLFCIQYTELWFWFGPISHFVFVIALSNPNKSILSD